MKFNYGLTEVETKIDENDISYFHVIHNGNMGNRINDVIKNFRSLFKFDDKIKFKIKNEEGSPDYHYEADFYFDF